MIFKFLFVVMDDNWDPSEEGIGNFYELETFFKENRADYDKYLEGEKSRFDWDGFHIFRIEETNTQSAYIYGEHLAFRAGLSTLDTTSVIIIDEEDGASVPSSPLTVKAVK
jgi:hypothetical protein